MTINVSTFKGMRATMSRDVQRTSHETTKP